MKCLSKSFQKREIYPKGENKSLNLFGKKEIHENLPLKKFWGNTLEKVVKASKIICTAFFKSKFKLQKLFEKSRSRTKQSKQENCHNVQHLETTLKRKL